MDPPRMLLFFSLFVFLFLYFPSSEASPVKAPRQYLPPQPGYIPVYIQDGDTPPDVESIYEVLDGQAQDPTQDKMDTDVQEVPQRTDSEEQELEESEQFIVRQLTDQDPGKDNEVRGLVEEVRKF